MSADFPFLNGSSSGVPPFSSPIDASKTSGGTTSKRAASSPKSEKAERVARQFQALFLMEIMKPMTETMAGSSMTGEESGSTKDLYSWFWGESLASHLGSAWPMPEMPGLDSADPSDSLSGLPGVSSLPLPQSALSGELDPAQMSFRVPTPETSPTQSPSRNAAAADASAVAPAPADRLTQDGAPAIESLMASAGRLFQLPVNLVRAMVSVESGGKSDAQSGKGAVGLLQLMPATAREMGIRDPKDPWENLYAGAKYLSKQLDRFGTVELALAAYNAGPGAVHRHNGVPPFTETRAYVRRVLEAKARLDQTNPQDA